MPRDGEGSTYSTLTQFNIATNDYRSGSEKSEYHTVVTWDRLAEICGQYLYQRRAAEGPRWLLVRSVARCGRVRVRGGAVRVRLSSVLLGGREVARLMVHGGQSMTRSGLGVMFGCVEVVLGRGMLDRHRDLP